MALTADSILPTITPYIGPILDIAWMVFQLLLIIGGLMYVALLYFYDTKLNIRQMSKGNRTIIVTVRAKSMKDKRTGTPRLTLFSLNPMIVFGLIKGEMINEPPAECLVPYKKGMTRKVYDLIKKDGIYYPIENFVLGYKHEVMVDKKDKDGKPLKDKEGKQIKIPELVYSTKGSGLEVSRDYDAEQAIENMLIEKATTYRSKKPVEIVAGLALVIICVIVSGVIMYFAWDKFGNMAQAIAGLREPLREGISGAVQQALGPG